MPPYATICRVKNEAQKWTENGQVMRGYTKICNDMPTTFIYWEVPDDEKFGLNNKRPLLNFSRGLLLHSPLLFRF